MFNLLVLTPNFTWLICKKLSIIFPRIFMGLFLVFINTDKEQQGALNMGINFVGPLAKQVGLKE